MDWRSLIEQVANALSTCDYTMAPVWHSPVSSTELVELERFLNAKLPQDLAQILSLSNGVSLLMRTKDYEVETGYLLWPIERIREENLHWQGQSATDEPRFLRFADAVNGDDYSFALTANREDHGPVFIHDHETSEQWQIAASLKEFLQQT